MIGIRKPASVRAVVNHGGHDLFNPDPQTPGLVMTRQMLGGAHDAAHADPDVKANSEDAFLRAMAELMQADHDRALTTGRGSSPGLSIGSVSLAATPLATCPRSLYPR